MDNGMDILNQGKVPKEAFLNLANNYPASGSFGEMPDTIEDMTFDTENMPGWSSTYDDTNVHFHGLEMVPHLFHPQGTDDPEAYWITIKPASEDESQRCYCYVFNIPDDHPQGTYMHHIHRHGADMMQAWAGMIGLVLIGDETTDESPFKELVDQGITTTEDVILWDFQAINSTRVSEDENVWVEGNFTPGIWGTCSEWADPDNELYELSPCDSSSHIRPVLTNNGYQPTYEMCKDEIVNFRVVNAQGAFRSALSIVPDKAENPGDQPALDFWVWSADAISWNEPYLKQAIFMSPGQRHEVLMQFDTVGRYLLMNKRVASTSARDPRIQAFIEVKDCSPPGGQTEIASLTFTPGKGGPENDITNDEIVSQVDIQFKLKTIRNQAPFGSFEVNGHRYGIDRIAETMKVGTASQWYISVTGEGWHPFHIHVNHFQVLAIDSPADDARTEIAAYNSTGDPISLLDAVQDFPYPMWRDTIQVPSDGYTLINNRFVRYTGKTVFHCHQLSHEETGMIANMMLDAPGGGAGPSSKSAKSKKAKKKGRGRLRNRDASYKETEN